MRALRVPLEGDQRTSQALHTPESHPIAALNNYLHRPRRTQREQIVRVPSAPAHKAPKMKETEASLTVCLRRAAPNMCRGVD